MAEEVQPAKRRKSVHDTNSLCVVCLAPDKKKKV